MRLRGGRDLSLRFEIKSIAVPQTMPVIVSGSLPHPYRCFIIASYDSYDKKNIACPFVVPDACPFDAGFTRVGHMRRWRRRRYGRHEWRRWLRQQPGNL